ncbi:hypothetical protein J7382_11960 [Shimia sp. R11_0]|uniref:hypothetical protein n=1 Tax=Shimia sp. R11_0 TaxID=2821096 RepID=UPI001ADC0608|nr:hypothetical protein [Shimia sp. R11_0]MBO9478251.1 hypothetical protein [Shimia sp. R11_0]
MSYAATLKRAVKHNPTWVNARIYEYALDDESHPLLANGEYRFDLREITYGFRDLRPETNFTISQAYQGSTVVTVITENPPDTSHLIQMGATWYSLQEVRASDALGATVSYIAGAMDIIPDIRNDTL